MFKYRVYVLCAIGIVASTVIAPALASAQCWAWEEYGTSGSELGQFDGPKGIVYLDNLIFVVDSGNNRVQKLNHFLPDSLGAVSAWGTFGQGEGQFNDPSGIAQDQSTGTLFVVDSGNHRIQKFNTDGVFLGEWGEHGAGEGQFVSPTFVAAGDGYVMVSDTGNKRVQIFSDDGAFIRIIGEEGSGEGQFLSPSGIYRGPYGSINVADSELNIVQTFTLAGEFQSRSTPLPAPARLMGLTQGWYADAGRNLVCTWFGHDDTCLDWSGISTGPPDSPFDVSYNADFWYSGALTDRGNDRIVIIQCPDPVRTTSWGALKARYE